ncbi:MAG: hypothetical protein GY794_22080 [bacterium]|nr:hypothetical protein [bacterium]
MSWRHALVVLGILAIGKVLQGLLEWSEILAVGGYHPHLWLVYPMVLMLALGVGEMLTTGQRSWRVFLWVFFAALAATAVRSTIQTFIEWMGVRFTVETGAGSSTYFGLGSRTNWPVFALAAWIFLPLGLSAARRSGRSVQIVVVAFIAAGLFHAVFFYDVAFRLAERSLAGNGPFSRRVGAELLEIQGPDTYFESVLGSLLEADWDHMEYDYDRDHWREKAIEVIRGHDNAAKAAYTLADLLRRKRSYRLAYHIDDLMIAHKRYEVVPIYLRYALVPDESGPGDCNDVLVRFGIPEAGLRLLIVAGIIEKDETGASELSDFDIDPGIRECLKSLLKKDVGVKYSKWASAVSDAINNAPSILPDSVQEEVDRELACRNRRSSAAVRWQHARGAVIRHRLVAMGELGVLKVIEDYRKQVGKRHIPDWEIPTNVFNAMRTLESRYKSADSQMKVAPPDYDAPTIEAFEAEVDAYVARVNAVITKYWCPTTRPGAK